MVPPKLKALVLIPKVTGSISFISSLAIVISVLRSKERRSRVYHRLLLGMSFCDLFGSLGLGLSTWPIPKESGIWLASGTTESCAIIGATNQFAAITVPTYNAVLALYYLVVIRYSWNERTIAKMEMVCHVLILATGLGTAIAGLVLKLFNPANWVCWIAPFPPDCDQSFSNGGETNCVRGDNASIYRMTFLYGELWVFFLIIFVSMSAIYWAVFSRERANRRYLGNRDSSSKHTRKVANQALLYVGAFYLTYIFGSITRVSQIVHGTAYYPVILCMAIFLPLQGTTINLLLLHHVRSILSSFLCQDF